MNYILGISSFYHDSGAVLLANGEIIGAVQEERFTRKKHDERFPKHSIEYLLSEAKITADDLSIVAFYDKPFLKFERLLETYHNHAPKGLKSFLMAMKAWLGEKLFLGKTIKRELKNLGRTKPINIIYPEHHLSHGASAFYPSPFKDAAIVTLDGVGEWATTTIAHGHDSSISMLKEVHFPDSIGLLYSAFTYYCGFKVNSGEYKLMGLAPYGLDIETTQSYIQKIKNKMIKIYDDGSFKLNHDFFNYQVGFTMSNDSQWENLFNLKRRTPESELTQDYMNLALAIQKVTEEIVLKIVTHAREITKSKNLVLSGGVALNCVANGKILEQGIFEKVWIQPASGDAGGALGAAYCAHYIYENNSREVNPNDSMDGSYLGPSFTNREAESFFRKYNAKYDVLSNEKLYKEVSKSIFENKVIGWFQGRMEYGPRALGNRSIIANPQSEDMQKKLNLKIKYREGFRPFAPSVMEEHINDFFEISDSSPYMLLVAPVKKDICHKYPDDFQSKPLYERLYFKRSSVPSITHIDYSARIQSVSQKTNPKYWNLINEFKKLSGCGMVVNTSFNVRGEPIVCTPEDAYKCFMRTEMDVLVVNNLVLYKDQQPHFDDKEKWEEEFTLD